MPVVPIETPSRHDLCHRLGTMDSVTPERSTRMTAPDSVARAQAHLEQAARDVYLDGINHKGLTHAAMVEPLYQALHHLDVMRQMEPATPAPEGALR
jgi:hypothetical protein